METPPQQLFQQQLFNTDFCNQCLDPTLCIRLLCCTHYTPDSAQSQILFSFEAVCGSSANCGLVSGCAGCKRQLDSPLPPPTRPSVLKPPPANVWHGQPRPKHVFDPIFQPSDSASENIILLHLLMTNNLAIWQFAKNADHSSDPSPKYIASPRPFPPGTSPSLSYQAGTHHRV